MAENGAHAEPAAVKKRSLMDRIEEKLHLRHHEEAPAVEAFPAPEVEAFPAPEVEAAPAPAVEAAPAPEVEAAPAPEVEAAPAPAVEAAPAPAVEAEDTSSSSSSDSEDEKHAPAPAPAMAAPEVEQSPPSVKSKVNRLFGREKPVHQVLGGGKPADVFLWRNKKESAGVLGTATVIWVLFELLEYHLLTLFCHILIFSLAILFLWANASTFIHKSPPRIPEINIPQEPILQFASAVSSEINRGLHLLREIALGRELKKFLAVIAGLWLFSILGSSCNLLTLVYITFVVLHTVPFLYEKHEDKVDSFAERAANEAKKQYVVVNDKYLSKLPKVPLYKKAA